MATPHSQFAVDLNAAGIGTSPGYAILSGNGAGLFAVQGNELIATRAFVPDDAGKKTLMLQVLDGSNALGTVMLDVQLTDNALLALTVDSDGDGFRDAFETTSGTNPNDAASKPTTSLVAYWNFNQTQTPYDVVGGIAGYFKNGAAFSADGAGHGGGSGNRSLDLGAFGNAFMNASAVTNLNRAAAGNKMTISFWQKLDTISNNFPFYAVSPSSGGQRGISAHTPNSTSLYFDVGGSYDQNRIIGAQPAGHDWQQWAHIALVRNGGTAEIWLNGTLLKSETGKTALKSDINRLVIGAGIDAATNQGFMGVLGKIDDFAFFSTALSPTHIASLAGGASPLSINAPANQAPVITTNSFTIPENLTGGTAVGTIAVSDPDGPGALNYSIYGGVLAQVFAINATTGVVSTTANAVINYEARNFYELTVIARDAAGASATRQIDIQINDVNEAPVIASGFSTTVLDNIPVGMVLGTMTSTDPDPGQSRSWSIASGNTGGSFAVNATTGVVTLAQPLNYATTPAYVLTLRVTDAGGLFAEKQVSIDLFSMQGITVDSDGDGFSDSFENLRGTNPNNAASVPTTVLAAYWNFDQSGAPSTFSDILRAVQGQPLAGAALSALGTGRTGAANDRAVDFGDSGSGTRVEVNSVAWLNQATAANTITISFWQKFNSSTGYATPFYGISPSSVSTQRGISGHTPWADNIVYFDQGGGEPANRVTTGPVSYSRVVWHHIAFVKNGGTMQIWVNGALLASQSGKTALKTDFTKLVLGADLNGFSAIRGKMDDFAVFRTALTASQIAALNSGASPLAIDAIVNNVAPSIATAALDFAEDTQASTAIGTVTASDPDGPGEIVWSMTDASGFFTINPATGVISTTESAAFDYETTARSYNVTVTATDAYEAVSSRQIVLNVADIIDEAPVVAGFNAALYDTVATGTQVGTPAITDADAGDTHSWSITAGNTGGAFAINPATGAITVAQPLDANVKRLYSLTVRATDSGDITGDATVKVSVFSMQGITADSDGDGYSNAFEISRYSDPNSVTSVPTTILAAYWNFDQSGTPSTFSDLVRTVQATPISGAVLSPAGTGRSGASGDRALDLGTAGTNTRAETSNVAWLNQVTAANKITISFWQKHETLSNNFSFYANSPSAADRGLGALTPYDGVIYFDTGGTATANRTSVAQPAGTNWLEWRHLVFVRNNDTAQIWLNGVLLKSETGKAALKTDLTNLLIGSGIGGTRSIKGDLDDFAVFNTNLTSAQIGKLAAGASPLTIDFPQVNPPTFVASPVDGGTIAEDAPTGTAVTTVSATDADPGDTIGYAITGGNPGNAFAINSATGEITVAAALNYETTAAYALTVTATDAAGHVDTGAVNIAIGNVNEAPAFAANPFSSAAVNEDAAYTGSIASAASDPDAGDTLGFAKLSGPAWLNIAANGALSGTPSNSNVGPNSFSVRVTDAAGLSSDATLQIAVMNTNDAPVFVGDPLTKPAGSTGVAYSGSLAADASDIDAGDTLTFSKVSGPTWLNVAANGALSGTPGTGNTGNNAFVVKVTDAASAEDTAALNITVNAALPAGWTVTNIGTVGTAGSSAHSGGTYSITASDTGYDTGTSDNFRFNWQTMSGDGEIKARITGMSGATSPFVSVMIRETTAGGSKCATTGSNIAGGIWAHTRATTGGGVASVGNGTLALPRWIRLVRTGNTFVSYRSSDGVNWTQVTSRNITMASQVLVGLAVTSRSTTTTHTATFDNVTIVP
ncbi:MAG: cadherin domain-containing protein [Verrucomicrobiota bacterium]